MSSSVEKIIGYFLLGLGLLGIIFSIYSVYGVFTDVSSPPQIFQSKSLTISVASPEAGKPVTEVQILLDSQLLKIVNAFLYYLFMIFILTASSNISGLGVKFIKEIKVEMKKEQV